VTTDVIAFGAVEIPSTTPLAVVTAALPKPNVRSTEPERRTPVAPTIAEIIEADNALMPGEVTLIERPAFTEPQPPVFKPHRPEPVEPPKPSEPISEATWESIQVGPKNKRTFTNEEREEIIPLDLKGEKLAKIAHQFGTSIPEIHKVLMGGLHSKENACESRERWSILTPSDHSFANFGVHRLAVENVECDLARVFDLPSESYVNHSMPRLVFFVGANHIPSRQGTSVGNSPIR
jgi:hypothetical protein